LYGAVQRADPVLQFGLLAGAVLQVIHRAAQLLLLFGKRAVDLAKPRMVGQCRCCHLAGIG
jgi:hypothetical protein